jgi:predicted component of type VI protein secretion system
MSREPGSGSSWLGVVPTQNGMAPSRSARLFYSPLPPVEVSAERPVVIGRCSECGFEIPADDVSRRHSEVFFAGGGFSVRDLGSTNGTYVNGRKISGDQRLVSGDRIELGSNRVTFCEVGAELEGLAPAQNQGQTVIFEHPAAAEGIRGDLAESAKQSGLDAALELVAILRGSFQFQANAEPDTRSIDLSMTEVLLEGSRVIDESGR